MLQSETKNMFIRHVWHFFTTLRRIFKALALSDKIHQSRVGSFFAFPDYNLADNSNNNLRSLDHQDSRF